MQVDVQERLVTRTLVRLTREDLVDCALRGAGIEAAVRTDMWFEGEDLVIELVQDREVAR